MKVRVVYKPDKSVVIIHPAPKRKGFNGADQEWLEYVLSKAMDTDLKDLPYDDIDKSELPQSREDRDAWRGEKGKGIWIDSIEAQRLRSEKENNGKIANKIRQIAIDKLIKEGELPPDYKMPLGRRK